MNFMDKPKLEIVICVKDALEAFRCCLESVFLCTRVPFKLIVVNDCSSADTKKFIDEISYMGSECVVVNNSWNMGYTASANIGFDKCRGDHVILLNSDTIVTSGWEEGLIRAVNKSPETVITSPLSNAAFYQSIPRIYDERGRYCVNALPGSFKLDDFAKLISDEFRGQTVDVPIVNGFCMCIKRVVIEGIGLFNERAFPVGYGEEIDLCIRIMKAGLRSSIALDAYVYHHKTRSFSSELRKSLVVDGNRMLFDLYGEQFVRKMFYDMEKNQTLRNVREIVLRKCYC